MNRHKTNNKMLQLNKHTNISIKCEGPKLLIKIQIAKWIKAKVQLYVVHEKLI